MSAPRIRRSCGGAAREHAATLYSRHLYPVHAQWAQYRAHYRLYSLPGEPPTMALLRSRAMLQAMADAERGYRVLAPVARLERA